MTRFLISALALLGMGIMANAQEKVKVHNGAESYVTTIEYVTFDATDADEVVSVSDLQSANATLATDKSNLEGQVTTLTSEKAELATAKTALEGQVTTLTSEKAELATAKTTLEGQVSTLTSEKTALETTVKSMEYALGERSKVHEYVDLGLTSGTLWATMNVGASKPEDYGDYFAWGETFPKSNYSWSTYFDTNDGGDTFVKYNNNGGKTELDDADDVAVQTWGGAWSMPTKTQQDELCKECDWEWTSINGVNGYKVKSRVNDNFIFLPAAGGRWDTLLDNVGSNGNYWSRSLDTNYSNDACNLYFTSGGVDWDYLSRSHGFSVRPVCPGVPK